MKKPMAGGRALCCLLLALSILVPAQRLPAPIEEPSDQPTLAPEESAKPKPKRTAKTKAPVENKETFATGQQTAKRNAFPGTWQGTIAQGIWGNVECTFIVDSTGNSVIEKSRLGTDTQPSKWNGKSVTWRSGVFFKEISWTLTPNPDGRTASVQCSSPFYGKPSATFHKTSS